jgi:hypothetical protein
MEREYLKQDDNLTGTVGNVGSNIVPIAEGTASRDNLHVKTQPSSQSYNGHSANSNMTQVQTVSMGTAQKKTGFAASTDFSMSSKSKSIEFHNNNPPNILRTRPVMHDSTVESQKSLETPASNESSGMPEQSCPSIKSSIRSGVSTNGRGRFRGNRSNPSLFSAGTTDGHLGVMKTKVAKLFEDIENSNSFKLWTRTCESISWQLAFHSIINTSIALSIVAVTRWVVESRLPNIGAYNLVHAFLSLQGKLLIFSGWFVSQVIAKVFLANAVIHSHGAPLVDVAAAKGKLNPPKTRTLRNLFWCTLFLTEIALWDMAYQMEWTPIKTFLGEYPCTPATYPVKPTIMDNLGNFLQGDTNFAKIYQYGLPLVDGLVGGWGAWPLATPAQTYSVESNGVLFVTNVVCAVPNVSTSTGPKTPATRIRLFNERFWNNVYVAAVQVWYPAGSHNWKGHEQDEVEQKCELILMSGAGRIQYSFGLDEWNMGNVEPVERVKIGDTVITPRMPEKMYFGTISRELESTNLIYSNVTSWIAEAIGAVFRNGSYLSSQGSTFANILQWATEPDGQYHVEYTARGFMASIGSIAHYVLMQYDGTVVDSCEYYGYKGHGTISASNWTKLLVYIAVGMSLGCHMALILAWALLTTGGPCADKVGQILDNPLRLLYEMREGAARLMPELGSEDFGQLSLKRHLAEVMVKFGEKRTTRGQEVGTLCLDAPSEVVKFRRGRCYTNAM